MLQKVTKTVFCTIFMLKEKECGRMHYTGLLGRVTQNEMYPEVSYIDCDANRQF